MGRTDVGGFAMDKQRLRDSDRHSCRLTDDELRAIGSSIAAIPRAGNTGDARNDEQPGEPRAETVPDGHRRFVASLEEGPREIAGRITARVGQLAARTSLEQLEHARGEVVRSNAVSGG